MTSLRHFRQDAALTLGLRAFCYVLLCVATWCGPVPWLHCHALAGNGDALTEHRHLHHPDGEVAGWHFHLVLLTELQSDGCGGDCPRHREPASPPLGLPLAYGASVACASAGTAPLATAIQLAQLDWPAATPVPSILFDTFTSPIGTAGAESPRAIDCRTEFCVARC